MKATIIRDQLKRLANEISREISLSFDPFNLEVNRILDGDDDKSKESDDFSEAVDEVSCQYDP